MPAEPLEGIRLRACKKGTAAVQWAEIEEGVRSTCVHRQLNRAGGVLGMAWVPVCIHRRHVSAVRALLIAYPAKLS
jgi:hypothetical protein